MKQAFKSQKKRLAIALITCSRSPVRQQIEKKTIENFFEKGREIVSVADLVVFDNASTFKDHWTPNSSGVPFSFYTSRKNLGLWSAINYLIEDFETNYENQFEYLYLVESDLIHKSFKTLDYLATILEKNSVLGMFRTQQFSRYQRWKYDKSFSFLPSIMHNSESAVSWRNAVSGEKATFSSIDGSRSFLATNLHAKLPGLHRMRTLRQVFSKLKRKGEFSENDFFRFYMEEYQTNGIMQGGIWRSSTSIFDYPEETASYAKSVAYEEAGYLRTRSATIDEYDADDVRMQRIGC